jgi:hypothetical protein
VPEHQKKWMSEHARYEELCSLAVAGLLEGSDFDDFQTHLKECSECQSDYDELSNLVTRDVPQAQGVIRPKLAAMRAKSLPYSRERFLRRARAEGLVLSPQVDTLARSGPWYFHRLTLLSSAAALVVVVVSLTVYHFFAGPDVTQPNGAAARQNVELERQNSALTSSLSQSNQVVATQQREIQDLRAQLANAVTIAGNLRRNSEQARGEVGRSSSPNAQLLDESRNHEKLLAEARDEAARSTQLRINDEASLVEERMRITELSNKLRVATATLDVERQLAASGNDFRELMAARQLHMIDVRDTDANGNPSDAFGRVFLAEGKSLTFYAFDLNNDSLFNTKRSFEVWASTESGQNAARSLGFLRLDAKAPGRWVLKIDNPDLLRQISAVFVTVEPAAGAKQPSTRKMFYAYLGNANLP